MVVAARLELGTSEKSGVGGMAQVLECLPSRHNVTEFKPQFFKKKKETSVLKRRARGIDQVEDCLPCVRTRVQSQY
jgi:hypothetical protein